MYTFWASLGSLCRICAWRVREVMPATAVGVEQVMRREWKSKTPVARVPGSIPASFRSAVSSFMLGTVGTMRSDSLAPLDLYSRSASANCGCMTTRSARCSWSSRPGA